MVATKGRLRADRSRDPLLDVFMVTFGDATYHLYSRELGWPHESIVAWMCEALPDLLLEPAQPGAKSRLKSVPATRR